MLYLLGAVLLYGGYGTLDIPLLAGGAARADRLHRAGADDRRPLAKTALFLLHIWLPLRRTAARRPRPVAVLSALVIKGSWFLVLRLWFDVLPGVASASAAQLAGRSGAAAIVVAAWSRCASSA